MNSEEEYSLVDAALRPAFNIGVFRCSSGLRIRTGEQIDSAQRIRDREGH